MQVGFITPNYIGEKRVALLPNDINGFENEIIIEEGFGNNLGIKDEEYISKGCSIASRREIFKNCDAIFSLKLIQPSDYELIREGQMIIGWTHPTGSGESFMKEVAIPKSNIIVDLDNISPKVYFKDQTYQIDWIPRNFIKSNSFIAGYASTLHAIMNYGLIIDSSIKVAVLGNGNVSQGAIAIIHKLGADLDIYYRKTMNEFRIKMSEYDIIINGIEVDVPGEHIISKNELSNLRKGTLIIDAAADAGNAIEGTKYTTIDKPTYSEDNVTFYEVNNSPAIFYKSASYEISKSFSKYVYSRDVSCFKKIIEKNSDLS